MKSNLTPSLSFPFKSVCKVLCHLCILLLSGAFYIASTLWPNRRVLRPIWKFFQSIQFLSRAPRRFLISSNCEWVLRYGFWCYSEISATTSLEFPILFSFSYFLHLFDSSISSIHIFYSEEFEINYLSWTNCTFAWWCQTYWQELIILSQDLVLPAFTYRWALKDQ